MNIEERLRSWKQKAEELRLQGHLGQKEASDAFEQRKKEMKRWLEERKSDLEELKGSSSEKVEDLKREMEELQVQLALGKAESRDALIEQQKRIETRSNELANKMHHMLDEAEDKSLNWARSSKEKLDQFRMEFDLFRLQFHLGVQEGSELWEENKKAFIEGLAKFKASVENLENKSEDKWDNFKSEISEAWDHFKKAF